MKGKYCYTLSLRVVENLGISFVLTEGATFHVPLGIESMEGGN